MTSMVDRLIRLFASHRLLAGLLLWVMLLLGFWGLMSLNTQFLPDFDVNMVKISVVWPGASPADVEQHIIVPIEQKIRNTRGVQSHSSIAIQQAGIILLNFKYKAYTPELLLKIRNEVDGIRSLPVGIERPVIEKIDHYIPFCYIAITSKDHLSQLVPWAKRFQQELLARGISKVELRGDVKQELVVQIDPIGLARAQLSFSDLSQRLKQQNISAGAGTVDHPLGQRSVRVLAEKRRPVTVGNLPIVHGDPSRLLHLLNIADPQYRDLKNTPRGFYFGRPSILLRLYRAPNMDLFSQVKALYQWKSSLPQLPQGLRIHIYYKMWHLLKQRINMLLRNGALGWLLILILLFMFFNLRIAFWVAMAIPISLAGALFFLYMMGGSINMVSLFALIMCLGIVIDDTMVVAEQSISEFHSGASPLDAATRGAHAMWLPVMAASLTTLAAFFPLVLPQSMYMDVFISIPRIVVAVILASIIECFLLLPRHLHMSFSSYQQNQQPHWRQRFNHYFNHFRDTYFKRLVKSSILRPGLVMTVTVTVVAITVCYCVLGHLRFSFFEQPSGQVLHVSISFQPGTSHLDMRHALTKIEHAIARADNKLRPNNNQSQLVESQVAYLYSPTPQYSTNTLKDTSLQAGITLVLSSPEGRSVTNEQFISAFEKQVPVLTAVNHIEVQRSRAGPPSSDIELTVNGKNLLVLKQVSQRIRKKLLTYQGVRFVSDNLPRDLDQLILHLKPTAVANGFTQRQLLEEVRAALVGVEINRFYQKGNEVKLLLRFPAAFRTGQKVFSHLPITLSSGHVVPLTALADVSFIKAFSVIPHESWRQGIKISAEVDSAQGHVSSILDDLRQHVLPSLQQQFHVRISTESLRSLEESHTLQEVQYALYAALTLIYIILIISTGSCLWPFFILLSIPLGMVGAIWGHVLLGVSLSIFSLLGFFGLAGIVVNDSIILIMTYRRLLAAGGDAFDAIAEACCQRFRPVLLTSVTTILGLLPLLFERSVQAKFLVPMAISITFGLGFATVLILILIPTLLGMTVRWQQRKKARIR